jgi:hypothetical protein
MEDLQFTRIEMYRDGGTLRAQGSDGNHYRIDGKMRSPTRGQLFINEQPANPEQQATIVPRLRAAYRATYTLPGE